MLKTLFETLIPLNEPQKAKVQDELQKVDSELKSLQKELQDDFSRATEFCLGNQSELSLRQEELCDKIAKKKLLIVALTDLLDGTVPLIKKEFVAKEKLDESRKQSNLHQKEIDGVVAVRSHLLSVLSEKE